MASPFAEAIMTSMVASMDPTIAMQRDAMQGYLAVQKDQALVEKAHAVSKISDLLAKSKDEGADTTVITAYQRLLHTLTA